jgi:hypothetical protein
MKRTSQTAMLGLVGLMVTACAPAITYPPEEGVLTSNAVPAEPVPLLMAKAIELTHTRHGQGDDFAVNLPPGTPPDIYDRVIRRIGAGHPMRDPDEPAYHVTRVASQGFEATVDLFYPKPDGTYGFATLSFHREVVGGWRHEHTRVWQTGDQPPPPSYTEVVTGAAPREQ